MMGTTHEDVRHALDHLPMFAARRIAVEKQAVIRPGSTPDLDITTTLVEKTAIDRPPEDEIKRLEVQDINNRLAKIFDQ